MLRSKVCSPCFSHPVSLAFSVCCSVSTYFLSGICSICHMTMYHVRTYVDLQRLRRELAMTFLVAFRLSAVCLNECIEIDFCGTASSDFDPVLVLLMQGAQLPERSLPDSGPTFAGLAPGRHPGCRSRKSPEE